MTTAWNPQQYLRFADERARPFEDLLARVDHQSPALIVDLGCGPGNMTVRLSDRWPSARVIGVDNSKEMLQLASPLARPGRLEFILEDLRLYDADEPVDVLVCAATLQWIPGHIDLIPQLLSSLATGGVFAFQVPIGTQQRSQVALRELATSARWRSRLSDVVAAPSPSLQPEAYLRALFDAGAVEVDVWETRYLHILQGPNPVLEWMKGTGLRAVLGALDDDNDKEEFLESYGSALSAAYPRDEAGRTVLPFRRIFAVGRASEKN